MLANEAPLARCTESESENQQLARPPSIMTLNFPDFLKTAKIPTDSLHPSLHSIRPASLKRFKTDAYRRGDRRSAGSVYALAGASC
eukprot:4996923-Pyramimonas_sp.AAC.1